MQKTTYKFIYTVNHFEGIEPEIQNLDSLLTPTLEEYEDVVNLLQRVEVEPDKRLIDNIFKRTDIYEKRM